MRPPQILTSFSNVEIFSVYLSNSSFDPLKNISKYKIESHRTYTKIKNKIKTLPHTVLGFQFIPGNLVNNFTWAWSWVLKVILLKIEVLVIFTLKASPKQEKINISSVNLTLVSWRRWKYLYFVITFSI